MNRTLEICFALILYLLCHRSECNTHAQKHNMLPIADLPAGKVKNVRKTIFQLFQSECYLFVFSSYLRQYTLLFTNASTKTKRQLYRNNRQPKLVVAVLNKLLLLLYRWQAYLILFIYRNLPNKFTHWKVWQQCNKKCIRYPLIWCSICRVCKQKSKLRYFVFS